MCFSSLRSPSYSIHTLTHHLASLSQQNAVFEGTGHPVDDEASVVAERGKEPGVS